MPAKWKTIDEYLATVPEPKRAALEKLRRTLRAAAPDAEECFSYGLPAFRQGRVIVCFAAAATHCSLYPMSAALVEAHTKDLAGFETSKGTIRFQPDAPLPAALIRKLVKERLAENAVRDAAAATRKRRPAARPKRASAAAPDVAALVAELERLGDPRRRAEMGPRFGIVADRAFGVPMPAIQKLAKTVARDHAVAAALWDTAIYDARLLAAYVDDPAQVTPSQMDRWARDFDNWGICDTVCFVLFDRTPHAFGRIDAWAPRQEEFVRRAAFALLASVGLHQRDLGDEPFLARLPLIEAHAPDPRNFVKKGVSWALRTVGSRSRALHGASVALARRLAASKDAAERWVGKDALRDLERPLVLQRVAKRS